MLPCLVLVAGLLTSNADPNEEAPPARLGQILIIGNEVTPQSLILDRLPLYPGQLLTFVGIRAASEKLAALNWLGITATVVVIQGENKPTDILVTVRETPVITYLL